LKRQVASVDAALGKLEAGTYGICATCGEEISADRMEFRPTSVRCMDCKTRDR
jgi:RNA polymerase-binding transcription factor DksA